MSVPPIESVYQLMLYPAAVAFRFVEPPTQTEGGVATTGVGAAIPLVTVTVTGTLVVLPQVVNDSA